MGIAYNTSMVSDGLVVYVDAANPRSYSGTGNTWYDLRGNRNFTLQNNPPFFANSAGGSIGFTAANSHWASSSTSLSLMTLNIIFWSQFAKISLLFLMNFSAQRIVCKEPSVGLSNSIILKLLKIEPSMLD